jgi:hypothetical protein
MTVAARNTPDARIVTLIKRASFELRLAADLTAFENYGPGLRALLEGARGNLRRCLNRLGQQAVDEQVTSDER